MPLGNRVLLGTSLPAESRVFSAQQSSMLTYSYPAAFRPLSTKMSAMPLTIASLNSARQAVVFQLLKPIGGVGARPSGRACAAGATRTALTIVVSTAGARVRMEIPLGEQQGVTLADPRACPGS